MTAQSPSGVQFSVQVPDGMAPGSTFVASVPVAQEQIQIQLTVQPGTSPG
jgi:hypothetical protein